ncbi:Beta-carotene 15,15'-monooxygenase, Brp/Blh family [Isosphaera pallida ATCC 43644]|uniref:Probable beta-carotene 15,15'-dioxygenase n=1 Tax=Isosphaera pallida (strain ATCC 43644 / DSM 9630 / IS1B) TaxID=575540 RepID=E8QX22_ISOPI|nr:Brp/Blh family beta-carotene 15,15'-dioxygenase [Isosphaera pallida]ADV64061.1 Beta-carotene 15,15'-monooxygenase, Brp/Blh family [Isosphaera pallida ATCC 43644]
MRADRSPSTFDCQARGSIALWLGPLALAGVLIAAGMSEALGVPIRSWPVWVEWLPWVVGLAVLGMPHGAFDHEIGPLLRRLSGRDRSGSLKAHLAFASGYLLLMAAVLLVWWVAPGLALALFLIAAALHFGQGDLVWSRPLRVAGGRIDRLAFLLTRGCVPIVLPVLAFPDLFGEALARFGGQTTASGGPPPPPLPQGTAAWWTAWLLVGGASLTQLIRGVSLASRRADLRRDIAAELGETALLWASFALVPPILAMGVYFHVWHALRHVERIADLAAPGRRPGVLATLGWFLKRTWPTNTAAFLLMGGLGWLAWDRIREPTDLGFLALAFLSAVTIPHLIVVAAMDRFQGVWSVKPVGSGGSIV